MSYRCDNCQSLFFKTLETRVLAEKAAILYKKRCKRCKFKYLVRKSAPSGPIQTATYQEWASGRKINTQTARISERGRVFVSEYTGRVSMPSDELLPYLKKLRHAQSQGTTIGNGDYDRPEA